MSILSSIKAAASRAVASAKALKTPAKKTTTVPKLDTAKVVANANYSTTPTKSIIGSSSALNNASIGGVTTPNVSKSIAQNAPAASLNAPAKASKSSGGSSKSVSGGQVADSYSSPSTPNISVAPSYTPSIQSINTPITTSEITSNSAITPGQTNAGLGSVSPYTGYGDKTLAYTQETDKGITEQMTPETSTDQTLKYIQEQMNQAAEDTRVDRADIERQVGLKNMQAEASAIKSQILGTKAQFETQRQSLIGQGRGIPEVIIGGQQEALDRQEAIKLMPMLAQYQIATDNLTAAQETVSNFIADEQAYLNRVYQTKVAVLDKAYDLAVGKEKDAITEIRRQEDNALAVAKENRSRIDEYYQLALENGDKTTAGSIAALIGQVDSPEFESLLSSRIANIQPKSTGGGVFGSLPTSTQNKLLSSAAEFNSRKEVQKFVATIDAANVLNVVDPKSQNPADHQAIVYGFAKALDPESVVRGEEYEAVKKYSQSLFNKYKGEISNAIAGTGFLSEDAISDMQTTISNLYNARLPIYQNAYNEKARTINSVAGADVANEILEGKTGGYTEKQSNTGLTAGATGKTSSGLGYTIE